MMVTSQWKIMEAPSLEHAVVPRTVRVSRYAVRVPTAVVVEAARAAAASTDAVAVVATRWLLGGVVAVLLMSV